MSKKKKARITHEQIEEAIKRFMEEKGLINQLPPQVVKYTHLINPKHGGSAFEPIFGSSNFSTC